MDVQTMMEDARTAERARTLFRDGYIASYPRHTAVDGAVLVEHPGEGKVYLVDTKTLGGWCTCPSFKHRKKCKHLYAVLFMQAEAEAIDAEIALREGAENFHTGTDYAEF